MNGLGDLLDITVTDFGVEHNEADAGGAANICPQRSLP